MLKNKIKIMGLLFAVLRKDFNEEAYKELLQKSFAVGSEEASISFFWDWVKSTDVKLASVEKIFNLFKLQVKDLLAY